ncbi:MAG TPA: L-lactate permease [Verrucomicrobiae bacterium]|jgi:lactate permease
MTWLQNYDPLDNAFLSTLVAALPIVVLLGSIAVLRIRIHFAALLGLGVALVVAVLVYHMPGKAAVATTVYGACYGLLPIGWIILNLIFLYQLTVEKGLFAVLRRNLAALAPDPRIQIILIAFSFGAFFEGAAGFGTPVAVTAAILIQLGFKPLAASGLSLIANTAPVAYGALGTPIIALSAVTGLDLKDLSSMVGRQLPIFSLIVPFWVVWAFAGLRGMMGVWPAALTAGVAFAIPQFLVSNFHGPWLVDIVASLVSLAAVVVLLKFWQPKDNWKNSAAGDTSPHLFSARTEPPLPVRNERGEGWGEGYFTADAPANLQARGPSSPHPSPPSAGGEGEKPGAPNSVSPAPSHPVYTSREIRRAWVPWVLLSVFVFLWGVPQVKDFFDGKAPAGSAAPPRVWAKFTSPKIPVANLHNVVVRIPPVVPAPIEGQPTKPEEAIFRLNWLSATGSGILTAAILAGLFMGFSITGLAKAYLKTLILVRFSLITIAAMLALGYVTKYSGTDATLGLALARTGVLYPFFGTLLGWLGVALTGSDTASNVLFGSLQKITAEQTGLSPTLMAAANSSGGVMGKMVDAQSIVVASTATNWYGHEGDILRYVFFHSIALAALVGVLVYLQAYIVPFTRLVVK